MFSTIGQPGRRPLKTDFYFLPKEFSTRYPRSLTSVTRWLLVVIGCAVLATAQPMSAAVEDTPAARSPDQVINPANSRENHVLVPSSSGSMSGSIILVFALVLAAGGAWVLLQRRQGGALVSRSEKKLQLAETRALGNRQYLVVADYDGQRFLLGVTPGQIQLLTPLKLATAEEKKP